MRSALPAWHLVNDTHTYILMDYEGGIPCCSPKDSAPCSSSQFPIGWYPNLHVNPLWTVKGETLFQHLELVATWQLIWVDNPNHSSVGAIHGLVMWGISHENKICTPKFMLNLEPKPTCRFRKGMYIYCLAAILFSFRSTRCNQKESERKVWF